MALIPPNICRRCHHEYSGLKSRCPYCGTRKTSASTRTARPTASAQQGTGARARANANAKWQMIFGGVLIIAIVIAVIALTAVSLNNREEKQAAVSPSADPIETPEIIETPTPTTVPPTQTPNVSSITITFLGSETSEFAMSPGDQIQLKANPYPLDVNAVVEWKSTNEGILTVDETGLVTGVSSGWADVTATCGAVTATCKVWVR